LSVRIIPRLDVKGPNLVKGVHLEGLRVMGFPDQYATRYYEDGADEIIFIDTVASLYGRNNLSEIVSLVASQTFIPLTVGGGIRSTEDIYNLLRAGADKIAINTGAIQNPGLIDAGAKSFGSQCIVLYVEAKQRDPGVYECLTDNAREASGVDVFEWVREAVDRGAGEILLTSVDREGTGKGYDIELTERVATMVNVPVIACGGAGSQAHVLQVIEQGRADAVCAASIFHYGLVDEMGEKPAEFTEGNIEFLKGRLPIQARGRRQIDQVSITRLKEGLDATGIQVRDPHGTVVNNAK